jgi:hypothetical protein
VQWELRIVVEMAAFVPVAVVGTVLLVLWLEKRQRRIERRRSR